MVGLEWRCPSGCYWTGTLKPLSPAGARTPRLPGCADRRMVNRPRPVEVIVLTAGLLFWVLVCAGGVLLSR
jgi:hypothetical protein